MLQTIIVRGRMKALTFVCVTGLSLLVAACSSSDGSPADIDAGADVTDVSVIELVTADDPVELLTTKAAEGYAPAQRLLGNEYFSGKRIEQDFVVAKALYEGAAAQGDAKAQHNLGVIYYAGQGVKSDYNQALKWYTLAADQSVMEAQYNLALMYYAGDGAETDRAIAKTWFQKACEQGSEAGCYAVESITDDELDAAGE